MNFRFIKELLKNQHQAAESLARIEKILMGIQEDFKAFITNVNTITNAISASLKSIQDEIAKIANDPATPADIASQATDSAAQLGILATTAAAIAANNQPVVPPLLSSCSPADAVKDFS